MKKRTEAVNRTHGFRHLIGLTIPLVILLAMAGTAAAVDNWFELGLADLKAKKYQAAVDKFSMAIEAVPDDFEALNNRGFARIYTGDFDGAIDDCSRSIAINPGSAKAYNNRGLARLFIGDFDEAILDFNQAIAINPRYVDAYSNRGLAWTQKEDFTRAITDCTEALHLNPRSAKALYCRGYARERQGDPGSAMRDYIQVLKVNPGYIEAFNSMAWIMATSPDERLRDGRRAVAYAEKAVENSAPDINFLDTLAAAYAEAGRFDEAVAIENRIISLLAKAQQGDTIPTHVKRMSLYEEGRPYREPVTIRSVSAVTDLQGELASLDHLVFAPAISHAAYEPDETAHDVTPGTTAENDTHRPMLLAQTTPEPAVTVPEAHSRSIQTAPDVPVEIILTAEPVSDSLNFEIETVPYQGALQGTLPNLLYTPRPGFEGVDRFSFRAHNANGPSNLATITITVAAKPEAPAEEEVSATPPETPVEADVTEEEDLPVTATAPVESTPAPVPEASTPPAMPVEDADEPTETTAPTPSPEAAPEVPEPPQTAAMPAPPAPEPPPADLPVDAVYTIQVRSVKEAAGAAKIVAKLQSEGYAAFSHAVEIPDKGQWHRVFINGYPTVAAAQDALGKLDPDRFKGAYVRRLPGDITPPQETSPAPQPEVAPTPEPRSTPEPEEAPAAAPAPDTDSEKQAIPVSGKYPYAYQVKSYKNKEEAFQLGVELTTQGHRAFIGRGTMGSTGVWYRVYIGCYQTPEEAEKSRSDIAREGFPEAFLKPIGFAIAVAPDETDPAGEMLENRLMASGFLPYRLPDDSDSGSPTILVGGFRHPEEASQVLAALEQSGFKGQLQPR